MAPKFYTEEWLDEVQKALAHDDDYKSKAGSLTFKNQYLIMDIPGGRDRLVTMTFEGGLMLNYSVEDKPAPSDWRTMRFDEKNYFMKVMGSYDTYGKINSGELSAMAAMLTKAYKIEGSMLKIMPKMAAIQAQAKIMSSVPVEY